MEEPNKISGLILLSLLISAISMGLLAYDHFSVQKIGYGIVFTILCFVFMAMAVYGLVRNNKIDRHCSPDH
jgi:hypothetical protein